MEESFFDNWISVRAQVPDLWQMACLGPCSHLKGQCQSFFLAGILGLMLHEISGWLDDLMLQIYGRVQMNQIFYSYGIETPPTTIAM